MYKIVLEDLKLFGKHGVFEEERIIGSHFIYNIEVQFAWQDSFENDDLTNGVDYSQLVLLIQEENKLSSNLLENLAQRILKRIYNDFNSVTKVKLRVSKTNPPINADIESISIELEQ